MHRWKQRVWGWAGLTALMAGCVAHGPPPRELIDARLAYQNASTSSSVQRERPQDLREAWEALLEAEREYDQSKNVARTRSLAYVALRKAQLAEAHASIVVADRQRVMAAQALAQAQEAERRRTEAELRAAQQQLAEAHRLRDEASRLTQAQRLAEIQAQVEAERRARQEAERRTAEQLEAERQARVEAERRATEALTRLERAGEVGVREDARGTVLTLSGSVLFASNQTELLPSARTRLSEVADALKQSDSALTIEGHTDALGPDSYNEELSLRRAEQVRDFLVSRGVPPDRISVRGLGEYRPVASNHTPEGRANNRRVEIVLQRSPADEGSRTGVGGSGQKTDPR